MKVRGIYLLLFLATMRFAEADWFSDPKWGYQVVIGSDIELVCNDTVANVMKGDVLEWRNPHGESILMDSDKYMLMADNDVNNLKLKVRDIQEADHGVYLCHIMRNNVKYWKINRAVNLHDPEYENLFDKYRYNTMIAGIAAAALFVPLVVMCLVYKYRYMTVEEKAFEKDARNARKMTHIEAGPLPVKEAPRNGGQYNKAYSESTNL